jgi:hypothetical protein
MNQHQRLLLWAVLWAVAGSILVTPRHLAGQEGREPSAPADTVYELVLTNGESYFGHVESSTREVLVFRTLSGVRLEVPRSQVRTLEPTAGRVVGGEVWLPDPNRTRLFFGPTARALDSGEGYVGLFELFFAFGATGVGDRLVLAGGTLVFPEALGQVLYLAPKVRLASMGQTDVAVGALAFFVLEELDEGSVGLVYAVGTHGSPDDAVSVGIGWGFAFGGDDPVISNEPVVMLGLEHRMSRRLKLISENYAVFVEGFNAVPSAGVRLLGDRFSADLGLAGILGEEAACCVPVLSAAYSF